MITLEIFFKVYFRIYKPCIHSSALINKLTEIIFMNESSNTQNYKLYWLKYLLGSRAFERLPSQTFPSRLAKIA